MVYLVRYNMREYENEHIVYDSVDDRFIIGVTTSHSARILTKLLNLMDKRIEYQQRVIDKCVKNDNKNICIIEDLNKELHESNQEIEILRRIIKEMERPY